MKNKKNLFLRQSHFGLWLALFALALLLTMNHLQISREALAARIAPGILRFHVMADSDGRADQAVKLEIRSLLLDFLGEHLPERADKGTVISYVSDHRKELEDVADDLLVRDGFNYRTSLSLVHDYFPSRTYAGLTFPCGYYDAVRVTLGSGHGHNWWCVLYPQFCFVEGVCNEIPAESMDILKNSINEDDFLLLTAKESRPELFIRLHLLPDFQITLCPPDP